MKATIRFNDGTALENQWVPGDKNNVWLLIVWRTPERKDLDMLLDVEEYILTGKLVYRESAP